MKKISILLASCNLFFLVGCGSSEKKPGEEYYDPNYKPKVNQSAAGTATDNATAQTNTADNTSAAADTNAGNAAAADMPAVTTPQPSGAKIEGAPANKDEVQVAVQPKDKLQASPAGKSFEKGKNLIAKSDCLACHKDDAKLVGPSYEEVANKYENNAKNVDFLVGKIIKGGAGSWGQIPMSPHPNLSSADAREMVNYILSLKK
ncbi:c-type cytochrome [Adhaeribacter rhizoryzae]|uniref:C-type cytochrome n=1 Tax=Adhaeribacter rhizoryzae TaxID=2607907 RepID=A0A5M6D7N4_9BACT|nr:c-type cytochrome [Adhaeribacter rhizoryzae]KAA5543527.1 c-type cytochrome [Adhaeribacter rhizoryzae]